MENSVLAKTKYIFSGHETFPLRYGWLKKVFDACKKIDEKGGSISRDLFNNMEAIAILGVGKNMVASMRHWAIYAGLLDIDENRNLTINPYARKIFDDKGLDPWMENYATLWFIHHKLATNPLLFTYYWIFNKSNIHEFDKDSLTATIKELLKDYNATVSSSTLRRDIECFLGVYCPKSAKEKSSEESIESPLTELGLISPLTRRDMFQLKIGTKSSISIYTFLYILLMFWKEYSPNASTLSLEAMCYAEKSPGRIFMINENNIGEFIANINTASKGLIEWSETAGLKQVILKQPIDFEQEAIKFFERNYK